MSNDFGIKVSLPGFNAETAADADLYFSSSWPTLKIDDALSGTMTLTGTAADAVTHNLGYPPFVMVFSHTNGFYPYYIGFINSTVVSFTGTNAQFNIGDQIRYYIFRNPLNINYQAPNINLASSKQGTNHQDFGIKFTKPGKESTSTDLRDYTVHSGTKSLQVHQVIYQKLAPTNDTSFGLPDFTTPLLKYVTDLPYRPVYFAFFSSDNVNFIPIFATSSVPPLVEYNRIDGSIIISNVNNGPGWGVFYIMLDPYISNNNIAVTL